MHADAIEFKSIEHISIHTSTLDLGKESIEVQQRVLKMQLSDQNMSSHVV